MKLNLFIFFLLHVTTSSTCFGYRILAIFPLNAKSHFIMYERLMKGLAQRGHQVDVISSYPLPSPFPNYTSITIPPTMPDQLDHFTYDLISTFDNIWQFHAYATVAGNDVCHLLFNDKKIQEIINNPPKKSPYDLVIVEIFSANCLAGFGHHLGVPVIGTSSSFWPWTSSMFGNPENLVTTPNTLLNIQYDRTDFIKRMYNVLFTFFTSLVFNYYRSPQDEMIKNAFGPDAPGLRELEKNYSLLLVNTHPSLNDPLSRVPAVVEVGGLHVVDDGPEIPPADKKWLDEANNGFIYFSFGSIILFESFPRHIIDSFYKSFAKISPVKIYMRVQQPEKLPPGLPENVKVFSWTTQIKVLKHENIRVFITHGGLMGGQEAIASGVPMICTPLFADQFDNVDLYVRRKIAIRLDHPDISEETLDSALKEILGNPTYKEKARELAGKFLDRPLSALETACFWIEFIGRHGSEALRSPSLDFNWWQIQLLDVYAVIFLIIVCFIFILVKSVKYLFTKAICSGMSESLKNKKNN